MKPLNFIKELEVGMDVVKVNGEKYLFTNARLDRDTIPDYLYAYDVRDNDECSGEFAEIKEFVMKNHLGTIVGCDPLTLEEGSYYCSEDDGNIVDFVSMNNFLACNIDIHFENNGLYDETEFDTDNIDEAKNLWIDFAKENNLSPDSIRIIIFLFDEGNDILRYFNSIAFTRDENETLEEFFKSIKEDMMTNFAWKVDL